MKRKNKFIKQTKLRSLIRYTQIEEHKKKTKFSFVSFIIYRKELFFTAYTESSGIQILIEIVAIDRSIITEYFLQPLCRYLLINSLRVVVWEHTFFLSLSRWISLVLFTLWFPRIEKLITPARCTNSVGSQWIHCAKKKNLEKCGFPPIQ